MKKYSEWLQDLKKSWEAKDYELLSSILHRDVEYFESPFLPPFNKIEVIKEWKTSLEKQDDIRVDWDILHSDEKECFAHWSASFMRNANRVNLDGVFHFQLNSDNQCIFF